MSTNDFSRRNFLKGIAGTAGLAMGTRLGGAGWLPLARAGNPAGKSALVIVNLAGGYNSMYSSADTLVGKQWPAMKAADVISIGAGSSAFGVHRLIGNLPSAKTNMASVGVRGITTCHGAAAAQMWASGNVNYAVKLAAEMGGNASLKAACIGPWVRDASRGEPQGGVSMQVLTDMSSTLQALGSSDSGPNLNDPARDAASQVMAGAHAMSKPQIQRNPRSMGDFDSSYGTIVGAYNTPPPKLPTFAEMAAPYEALYGTNKKISTTVGDLYSKFVGAELMLRAGTNVVVLDDNIFLNNASTWDIHEETGRVDLEQMQGINYNSFGISLIKGFSVFLDRVFNSPGLADMNITVALMGEFARSVPDSGHQGNLTASVFGARVKTGTTGRTDARNGLAPDAPPHAAFWGYLAALSGVKTNPFGSYAYHQSLIA